MTSARVDDGDGDREYRVVRRRRGSADEWQTVITGRGLGRPFNSPAAAKGLVTREARWESNRAYEYKVQ